MDSKHTIKVMGVAPLTVAASEQRWRVCKRCNQRYEKPTSHSVDGSIHLQAS